MDSTTEQWWTGFVLEGRPFSSAPSSDIQEQVTIQVDTSSTNVNFLAPQPELVSPNFGYDTTFQPQYYPTSELPFFNDTLPSPFSPATAYPWEQEIQQTTDHGGSQQSPQIGLQTQFGNEQYLYSPTDTSAFSETESGSHDFDYLSVPRLERRSSTGSSRPVTTSTLPRPRSASATVRSNQRIKPYSRESSCDSFSSSVFETDTSSPEDATGSSVVRDTIATESVKKATKARRKKRSIITCDICGSTFTAVHNFNRHRNAHLNINRVICRCGKSFSNKSDLQRHKKKTCLEKDADDEEQRQNNFDPELLSPM